MNIQIEINNRSQYLYLSDKGIKIAAARYQITSDRFSPWLVTHGKEHLPTNAIARGKYLTKLFNQH